jgi:hypothetical protein
MLMYFFAVSVLSLLPDDDVMALNSSYIIDQQQPFFDDVTAASMKRMPASPSSTVG